MSRCREVIFHAALAMVLMGGSAWAGAYGIGRAAQPDEIAAWDRDVRPDGTGLPAGAGSVTDGEALFSQHCAACHGDFAEGVDNWPALSGGFDTLDQDDPVKTVGSYWPYLSTLWDYIHRSKPYGQAQSLAVDEVYAVVAYLLYSNDLVAEDFVLTQGNFLSVSMPNADGFIIDDRDVAEYPRFSKAPCMTACKDVVTITNRASALDLTPQSQSPDVVAKPQSADPAHLKAGEKTFKKCKGCHQVGPGASNRIGPHLNGIFGRKAAGVDGFFYSKGLERAANDGLVWDFARLDAYLENPKALVSGTRMSFRGLKDPGDRQNVLAYLRQFSDNPSDIPEAAPTAIPHEVVLSAETLALVGDPEYGEYLSAECTTCHQRDGSDAGIPSITRWPAEDFVVAMHAYKRKIRPHPVMQMMAGRLDDEEIAALAAFFEGLE